MSGYQPGLSSEEVTKNLTDIIANKIEIFWPMGHIVRLEKLEITMRQAPLPTTTASTTTTQNQQNSDWQTNFRRILTKSNSYKISLIVLF